MLALYDKFTPDFEGIVVVRQAATCHLLNLYNTIVFLFYSDERVDPRFHATARHTTLLNLNKRSAQVSALSSETQLLRVSKRVLQVVLSTCRSNN